MIAQSQSGTGKTAAFVLAMLSRVNTDFKHPQVLAKKLKSFVNRYKKCKFYFWQIDQVLCLSPTYELALQIGEVAGKMSRFCPDLTIRCTLSLCSCTHRYVTIDFNIKHPTCLHFDLYCLIAIKSLNRFCQHHFDLLNQICCEG